jgi:hypothetical protein
MIAVPGHLVARCVARRLKRLGSCTFGGALVPKTRVFVDLLQAWFEREPQ